MTCNCSTHNSTGLYHWGFSTQTFYLYSCTFQWFTGLLSWISHGFFNGNKLGSRKNPSWRESSFITDQDLL